MRYLLDYLPRHLQEVEELRQIMEAAQPEAEALGAAVDRLLENQFPETADAAGLDRLERAFGAEAYAGGTPEERRFALKALLGEKRPCTMGGLAKQLAFLCGENGYTLTADPAAFRLTVRLALASKRNLEAAGRMLESMKPAAITLDLDLLYNRHSMLEDAAHGRLHSLRHKEIRAEVLPIWGV